MASSGPLGRSFTVREAPGFLEKAVSLVGSAEQWDEMALNFSLRLCRAPYFGEEILPQFRALTVLTDPQLTVYYLVIEGDNAVELIDIEQV